MLSRAPFVSVTLFFAAGILAGDALRRFADVPAALFAAALVLLAMGCFWLYLNKSKSAFAVCMSVWMLLLGASCKTWTEQERDRRLAGLHALKYNVFEAEVASIPEKRANSIHFEVLAERFQCSGRWMTRPVRALLYLPDSLATVPAPGDRLLVCGQLQQPEAPQNPAQFDYAAYLRNKSILFTAFVRADAYKVVSQGDPGSPVRWPQTVSQWADNQFRTNIADSAAYGLVKAMLLGRRDELRDQQVGDYIISGAVHILSVSGMHVAIIFLVIRAAFGWLRRWPAGRWLYLAIVAGLIGFYGLVTGLTPSVQRAALMCMVLVAAEVGGRKPHSLNTLAFSALVILLLDPGALYDVGFQLSYLAMAGIFLLYEPVSELFVPDNRLVKWLWQITALALAAQLATFPLSLFYFHQFPTYFWLVNPLVVTFTNVLLPAGLVLLLVSASGLSWLAWMTGQVVSVSAWLTDWSASIPRYLPGYLIEHLHLNALEVCLLYSVIFLGWYMLQMRSVAALRLAALVIVMFAAVSVSLSLDRYLTAEQVRFRIPRHEVVGFKSADALYLVSDKSFAADQRAFDFYVKNYAVANEIAHIVPVTPP